MDPCLTRVNPDNPRKGWQIIGNYRRDATRRNSRSDWTFGPWRRVFPLSYAIYVQTNRRMCSRKDRKRIFGSEYR